MKRLMILPALCLAFAAMAQPPADATAEATPQPQAAPASEAEAPAPADAKAGKRVGERHCLRETGSRLVRRDARACDAQPGRVYTREDLDRTGHTDLVQALRTLDTSIR